MLPLSWNEIRDRALAFSKVWANESSEDAESKTFWDSFFNIFGISRRHIASFEVPSKKSDGRGGFIDLLWKGVLLVEHKSRGKNLDIAYEQAKLYFPGIRENDLPRFVIVSDFARIRLYDLDKNDKIDFHLNDLYKYVERFWFMAGYEHYTQKSQDQADIEAAERLGELHDQLKIVGYEGHNLEVYLVRILYCLFADDTGIFERKQFLQFIKNRTSEDGSDLGSHITTLFENLNLSISNRLKNLDEQIATFTYIDGKLFEERLPSAAFDKKMREKLLHCCSLDWSLISPAIFGSLFQSVMDKELRRNLGAHYTTEENILKVIKPLFLDDLWLEFEKIKNNREQLLNLQKKLRSMKFFDPACGCGNFLTITYRELRKLENEILFEIYKRYSGDTSFDIKEKILVNIDQFYGIEIEEFPHQIARVSLWMTDHQMNLKISEKFGQYYTRLPLVTNPNIICSNALDKDFDWGDFVKPNKYTYIISNPPFMEVNNIKIFHRKKI